MARCMDKDRYFSVNAIVLKYSDFSESSRILTLFSDEFGLIKASARAARRKDSKALPLIQPFAFCRYDLCRGKNDIHTVTGGELIENFYDLTRDIGRFTAAGTVTGELLSNLVQDEPEPEVLRLYLNTLFTLCYTKKAPELVSAVFSLRLRHELGFLPEAEEVLRRNGNRNKNENKNENEDGRTDNDAGILKNVLSHIFSSELKQLYGFELSEDLAGTVIELAGRLKTEDR